VSRVGVLHATVGTTAGQPSLKTTVPIKPPAMLAVWEAAFQVCMPSISPSCFSFSLPTVGMKRAVRKIAPLVDEGFGPTLAAAAAYGEQGSAACSAVKYAGWLDMLMNPTVLKRPPTIAEQESDGFRLLPAALRLKLPPDLAPQLGCGAGAWVGNEL